ncbi:MAG: endonuclease/exonuclease/phosphatase family protein [Planctomycetota bacterium]
MSSSLRSQEPTASRRAEGSIRFATFNISFYRKSEGELKKELQEKPESAQPRKVAEIIQRVRPDVLLLNEFDYDKNGEALAAFQKNFLEVAQGEQAPIKYPYSYVGPVNTGVDTKIDLDGDGKTGTGNDCYGFGRYPGQYGMAILSRYPIDQDNVRTFQRFRWTDMPNHQMPFKVGTQDPYYSDEAIEVFRLSSKSHWDVPIKLNNQDSIHFLVAHPTPPVFDQEEDRNGRRNHDEIRMFADYVTPDKADYLYDDQGGRGGLAAGVKFVIAGDMNADPNDGDSSMSAANQLTEHPLINHSIDPSSSGGAHYAKSQGGKNLEHKGPANTDTGDFGDSNVGNLRIDYCLPSKNLELIQAGVFWPKPGEPGAKLINASDHRMVWIDLKK